MKNVPWGALPTFTLLGEVQRKLGHSPVPKAPGLDKKFTLEGSAERGPDYRDKENSGYKGR